MLHRIAPVLCAAALAFATSAWAQSEITQARPEIRGIVSHVDASTRTIYLADGRVVQLSPGATLSINGQSIPVEYIRPGTTFLMNATPGLVVNPPAGQGQSPPPGQTTTTVTTVIQTQSAPPPQAVPQPQAVPPPPAAPPAPPLQVQPAPVPGPVSATGTIARIDPSTQTLTFQDGRMVRVEAQTMVSQQGPMVSSLPPGTRVAVREATPVGYLPAVGSTAFAVQPPGQWMMGTVSHVDPGRQQIMLNNGTLVYVGPTTPLRMGNERVPLASLRAGDELVLMVRPPTPASTAGTIPVMSASDRYAGSALPSQNYPDNRVEASDVLIVWTPLTR